MILFNYITYWVIFINVCAQECEPCEENSVCRISHNFKYYENMPQQYIWKSNGVDVAVCYILRFTQCWLYPQYQNVLKSSIQIESESITADIVLTNTNRQGSNISSERKWELYASFDNGTLQKHYSCDVKIFKKIKDFSCDFKTSDKGVLIKCVSSMVYPQSDCEFNVTIHKERIQINQAVIYKHTVVHHDPVYYNTECSLLITKEEILVGLLEYEVTAFPNISNDKTFESRANFRSKINIEYPEVRLKQCPSAIEEGTEFHCICQREDRSDIDTRIFWDDINSAAVNRQMALLTQTASRNKTEFHCNATNAFLWKNFQKYIPTINNYTDCATEKSCFKNCTTDEVICQNSQVYVCQNYKTEYLELKIWCLKKSLDEIKAMKSFTCKEACQSVYKYQSHTDKISESYDTKLVTIFSSTAIVIGIFVVLTVVLLIRRKTCRRNSNDVQKANDDIRLM